MTSRTVRESLNAQLIDTERLIKLSAGHPLMSRSLQRRTESLQQRLNELPLDNKEAKVVLFFSGKPVSGSEGIDADFAGKVIRPFQNMVKTDFAQTTHGKVGKRGPSKSNIDAQLFLTALPVLRLVWN